MPEESLPKNERLTSGEVKQVFNKGTRLRGKLLTLIFASQDRESVSNKVAAVVSKKASKKAVVRNRAKRIIREAYRKSKKQFPAPYHYVFLQNRIPQDLTYQAILEEVALLASKIKK